MSTNEEQFQELKDDIREIKSELKLFTDAWQQARGVITFIKWFTGIAGGITAFFLFIKDHIK